MKETEQEPLIEDVFQAMHDGSREEAPQPREEPWPLPDPFDRETDWPVTFLPGRRPATVSGL